MHLPTTQFAIAWQTRKVFPKATICSQTTGVLHVRMCCTLHSGSAIMLYGVATISRLLKIIGLFCRI